MVSNRLLRILIRYTFIVQAQFQDIDVRITNGGKCIEFSAISSASSGQFDQSVYYVFSLSLYGQVEVRVQELLVSTRFLYADSFFFELEHKANFGTYSSKQIV